MQDVHFYWAGDGVYRDQVLPALEKYKNFHWIGSLEYPDKVREFLTEIDVYALISGIDMSPLTLQEAQLMEKPVVATNVGGIPELISHDETGLLVPPENSEQIANAVNELLSNPEKAKKLAINGNNFVKNNMTWDVMLPKFIKFYEDLLNN